MSRDARATLRAPVRVRLRRSPADRRQALRRLVRALHRRRHLLDAADARPTGRHQPYVAALRGQAAAQGPHRAAQEPALVLPAPAELLPARTAATRARIDAMRMSRSWVTRTPFVYVESQGDTQLLLAGVSRLHIVEQDGSSAHASEESRPDHARSRPAVDPAVSVTDAAPRLSGSVADAFARTAARCPDA